MTTQRLNSRRARTARTCLFLAGLLGSGSAALAGQAAPAPDADHYRLVSFSPKSGPPGTTVTVSVRELPSITPVYVTLGGTSSGFEVLGGMLLTNLSGELTETVRVPSWATRDQLHLFVIMDVYFGRLAASAPFHVTGPDGTLMREGTVERVEGPCAALRGEDGELYGLRGHRTALEVGDEVVVEGRVAGSSSCPGGITIQVSRVSELGTP